MNLTLDTRIFQVEFAGGKVTELTTKVFAKSIQNSNEYLLLDVLVDYHKDNKAISLTDQQPSTHGRPVIHKTTEGWQICCQWKDGCTSWDKLSKLKESHLMQTAKFAVVQRIDHEPAFE